MLCEQVHVLLHADLDLHLVMVVARRGQLTRVKYLVEHSNLAVCTRRICVLRRHVLLYQSPAILEAKGHEHRTRNIHEKSDHSSEDHLHEPTLFVRCRWRHAGAG